MNDSKTDNLDNDVVDAVEDAVSHDGDVVEVAEHADVDEHLDHVEEVYEEERSKSFSARVLSWLVLLCAGAGLALWGGPKLAPNLPEWAAPAAKFMVPGTDAATAKIEALRGEIDGKIETSISSIDVGPDEGAITEIVKAELGSAEARFAEQIAAIEDKLNATDGAAIEERLAQLETRVEGVSAEIASLNTSVQKAVAEGGGVSEETLAEITSKSAEVEGMRAEIGDLSGQIGKLNQRIDDVEVAATRKVEEAQANAAEVQAQAEAIATNTAYAGALDTVTAKVASGGAFATELAALASTKDDIKIPAELTAASGTGIASLSSLKGEFTQASHLAIRNSIKAKAEESGGTMSKVGAFFQSQVATRSLAPKEGDSTDAILSRMEAALASGDLTTVTTEAETLSEEARAPLADWLERIKTRNAVLTALGTLASQPS